MLHDLKKGHNRNKRPLIANIINQSIRTFSFCEGNNNNEKMGPMKVPYKHIGDISILNHLNVDVVIQCAGMLYANLANLHNRGP